MKKKIAALLATLAIGAALVFSGCASTQADTGRGAMASRTMQTVEDDIRLVIANINSAGESLASFISPNQSDLDGAFALYSTNVDDVAASSTVYIEHSNEMGVLGSDYFDEWRVEGATYVNPEIRSLSEQRRGELLAVYDQIAMASVGVQDSVRAHLVNLQEIRSYLSTDLTARGIEVITPVALDGIANGYALNNSLGSVLAYIGDVRDALAAGADR